MHAHVGKQCTINVGPCKALRGTIQSVGDTFATIYVPARVEGKTAKVKLGDYTM